MPSSIREVLGASDKDLPYAAATDATEWRYDTRPWISGSADPDVVWTLDRLDAAADAWERPRPR